MPCDLVIKQCEDIPEIVGISIVAIELGPNLKFDF